MVIDGDGAMREAIKQIFPNATHRLCAWHLNKNAGENVKNSEFLEGFKRAMYSNISKDQFEEFWSELIKENDLESNPWVTKTYENKALWATAYLRDNFFGRIRTTSQCEAVNAIIKSYVRKKGCIFEFMHNFDEALRHYRNNELVADFKSKFSDSVLTTPLRVIESDAARIYTAEIFKEVKEEIMKAGALIVKSLVSFGDVKMYNLTKYRQGKYERRVIYDGTTFQRSCKLFDSRGLPCSHIFYVMKEQHVENIPSSMVLSRWINDAKIDYLNMVDPGIVDSNSIEVARFGAYYSLFTTFCKEASKKNGIYGEIMEDVMKLHKKYCSMDDQNVTQSANVGDPIAVKSKGAPKKKKNDTKASRHCSKCNSTTHNARNCSSTANAPSEQNVELESVSISQCISQISKKKKQKRTCNDKISVQKKFSANVDVTSTSRQVPPMHGMSAKGNPNSCCSLLQQVINSAGVD